MDNEKRYDWYEEDFASFLLSLNLPAYRKDMPTKVALSSEKETFVSGFDEMIGKRKFRSFSDKFYKAIESVLPDIKRNFDLLTTIIEEYDNADMASAQNSFDLLMDGLKSHFFIRDIFWPHLPTNFYRVRVSTKEKLSKPRDLFHIPYNKRHLVGNERYSLAGHPCLYLASFLQIAWQECGYPHQYYYSEFQYQAAAEDEEEWKFITFLSPKEIAQTWFVAINPPEEKYTRLAADYLITYPLIFACSIVNLNGNSAFKPEYVIPQMLTQWVYRNYSEVKGIKYFSCYDTDDIRHYNGFNVVIPAKMKDRRKSFSEDLIDKFKVSKPVLLENKLGEGASSIVRKYKSDIVSVMHDSFLEAGDCLIAFFEATDLLDKAIRYVDDSEMRLIVSTIRSVSTNGRILAEKYKKDDIVNSARKSETYNSRTEKRIDSFIQIYDRFSTDIIEIADSFDRMMGSNYSDEKTEFFFIS